MTANEHLGRQFDSLEEVQKTGHVTDEWSKWQQGKCGTYAVALTRLRPDLHFGTLVEHDDDYDVPVHHFAHDDKFAYDSAGKHPLPYRGIEGHYTPVLHEQPDWYGIPEEEAGPEGPEEHIRAAMEHARRNRILG